MDIGDLGAVWKEFDEEVEVDELLDVDLRKLMMDVRGDAPNAASTRVFAQPCNSVLVRAM